MPYLIVNGITAAKEIINDYRLTGRKGKIMDKKAKTIAVFIIASAIIWAAVIIGCAAALSGTGCYDKIRMVLSGGVLAHILLIWGPVVLLLKKKKENNSNAVINKTG
jgi:roadblock/LC7 domain-containing protein